MFKFVTNHLTQAQQFSTSLTLLFPLILLAYIFFTIFFTFSDNLPSTAHKNNHSPFSNHPLKDGNRRDLHSHTSQHHLTMTSDVESGLNQSGFDKSSPITQSASAHLGTHLNSSSPNFEVSRNSAGISRNSTPETVQTQIQQIQPSFSPDVSANAETLTSVSPAKTPTSKQCCTFCYNFKDLIIIAL